MVIHASTRKSIACFGAVSLASGKFIYAISAIFNAVTFEAFLKQLLRHRSRNKTMMVTSWWGFQLVNMMTPLMLVPCWVRRWTRPENPPLPSLGIDRGIVHGVG